MRVLARFLVVVYLAVSFCLFPQVVLAQSEPDCTNQNIPTSLACIPIFVGNIADQAVVLAAVVAVFFVTVAGIGLITSGGDAGRVESAKKTMTFAIIGLLIILFAFTIIKVVARVVDTDCGVFGLADCNKSITK